MIFRVQKTENYVVLDKGFINDRALSLQAKGLLAVMLALPNDWKFNEVDLVKRSANGRDAVRSVIKELQAAGYIVKEQQRKSGRFDRPDFVVYEKPMKEGPPSPGNPSTDKPATGKPATENPTLLSNNVLNNNLLSNKDTKETIVGNESPTIDEAPPAPPAEETKGPDIPYKAIVDYLNSAAGTGYRANGKKTQSLIRSRYSDGFELADFEKVIDVKTAEWLGKTKWAKYLRPETLFAADKFEGYLNEWRLKHGGAKGRTSKQSNFSEDVGF